MKIATLRRVSTDDLNKTGETVPKWATVMLETVNDFIEKVGTAVSGNLDLANNFLGKTSKLTYTHAVEQIINPFPIGSKNLSVIGVIPLSAGGQGIDKFKWVQKSNNSIGVTFNFDGGASTTTSVCTVYILLG